jgi:hypothetical protein
VQQNNSHILAKFSPCLISIKFWLAFFFVIRLVGITNPPLERGHDWRQCLTNMISRNLYETSPNPMYPLVDNGGRHEEGIIASEFPVFNYAVYLVSIPFGYDHWYGRLINLIFSTIAAWYFYKLLKTFFSESIAFNATFLLTVSIWFGFSRKSMPDVFSMSLMLIAIYHAFMFFKLKNSWHLAAYGILAALAVLAKLPAIFAFSILALPILNKTNNLLPKFSMITVSLAVCSLAYWWYFVWGDYLFKTWGYQLFFPKTILEGINESKPFWNKSIEQFYFSAFQSFLAFAVFIFGVFVSFKNRLKIPLLILGVTFPVFLAFALKTGSVFPFHNYYIIPFVPVMAIIAGIGLSYLPTKIYPWLLVIITIESIANQQHDFFIKSSEKFKLSLEKEINTYVPLKEKIALAGNTGPQYLYFAHRKGWGLSPEQTLDTSYMKFLIHRNYTYLVVIKREFSILPNYRLMAETNNLWIYKIK